MRILSPESISSADLFASIREIVARLLPGIRYRLYLFGSRVQGQATRRSDYDLGIMADGVLPLSTLARIREELEKIPVLQRIDFVDLSAANPAFVAIALKTSQLIDERGLLPLPAGRL